MNNSNEATSSAAAATASTSEDAIKPWSIAVKTVGQTYEHIRNHNSSGAAELQGNGGEGNFFVSVSPEDSMASLHDQIEHITGLKASQQRLIYRGRLIGRSDQLNGKAGNSSLHPPTPTAATTSTSPFASASTSTSPDGAPISPSSASPTTPQQVASTAPSAGIGSPEFASPALRLCEPKIKEIEGLCDGQTIHLVKRRETPSSTPERSGSNNNNNNNNNLQNTQVADGMSPLLAATLGFNGYSSLTGGGNGGGTTAGNPSSASSTTASASTSAGRRRLRTIRRPRYRLTEEDLELSDPGSMESVRQGLMTLHTMLPHAQTTIASDAGINEASPDNAHSHTHAQLSSATGRARSGSTASAGTNATANTAATAVNASLLDPVRANRQWFLGQWIDCRDTVNQWLEATIVEIVDPDEILPPRRQREAPIAAEVMNEGPAEYASANICGNAKDEENEEDEENSEKDATANGVDAVAVVFAAEGAEEEAKVACKPASANIKVDGNIEYDDTLADKHLSGEPSEPDEAAQEQKQNNESESDSNPAEEEPDEPVQGGHIAAPLLRRNTDFENDPAVSETDLDGRLRLLLKPCSEGDEDDEGGALAGYRRRDNNEGVQLLLIHYNGWPHRWDEWIRSDSERLRPFRTRTRHPATSSTLSPTPQSVYHESPMTYITEGGEMTDRAAVLPELARALNAVNALLGQAIGPDAAIMNAPMASTVRADRLPWVDPAQASSQRQAQSTTRNPVAGHRTSRNSANPHVGRNARSQSLGSYPTIATDDEDSSADMAYHHFPRVRTHHQRQQRRNRRQLELLAPMLDRLGRTLVDVAPHVASLSTALPSQRYPIGPVSASSSSSEDDIDNVDGGDDDANEENNGGNGRGNIEGGLESGSHAEGVARAQSNGNNSIAGNAEDDDSGEDVDDLPDLITTNDRADPSLLNWSNPYGQVDLESALSELAPAPATHPLLSEGVDPDHVDYASGVVNTTRGEVRSGPRTRSRDSDDVANLLGAYLAAASLSGISLDSDSNNGGDGAAGGLRGLAQLLRNRNSTSTSNGGIDIHIHAVVTAPGMNSGGGTTMAAAGDGGTSGNGGGATPGLGGASTGGAAGGINGNDGNAANQNANSIGFIQSLFSSGSNQPRAAGEQPHAGSEEEGGATSDEDDYDDLFSDLYSENPEPINPNANPPPEHNVSTEIAPAASTPAPAARPAQSAATVQPTTTIASPTSSVRRRSSTETVSWNPRQRPRTRDNDRESSGSENRGWGRLFRRRSNRSNGDGSNS